MRNPVDEEKLTMARWLLEQIERLERLANGRSEELSQLLDVKLVPDRAEFLRLAKRRLMDRETGGWGLFYDVEATEVPIAPREPAGPVALAPATATVPTEPAQSRKLKAEQRREDREKVRRTLEDLTARAEVVDVTMLDLEMAVTRSPYGSPRWYRWMKADINEWMKAHNDIWQSYRQRNHEVAYRRRR